MLPWIAVQNDRFCDPTRKAAPKLVCSEISIPILNLRATNYWEEEVLFKLETKTASIQLSQVNTFSERFTLRKLNYIVAN